MCTVSWLPTANGYALWFSRDERRTRSRGRAPQRHAAHHVAWLAPSDPDAGGTWIGVNDHGLTVAIANVRAPQESSTLAAPWRSRGLLVTELLDARGPVEVEARVAAIDLRQYAPCTLVVVGAGWPARLLAWDGESLATAFRGGPGLLITSSGAPHGQPIEAFRRAHFGHALSEAGVLGPELFERLHRGHFSGVGAASVCMHREDAETVSLTHVEVSPDRVAMTYTPGPPCRTRACPTLALPRADLRMAS